MVNSPADAKFIEFIAIVDEKAPANRTEESIALSFS